jgi:hypothetical protein
MLRILLICLWLIPLQAQTSQEAVAVKKKTVLFDGKTLNGWYTWLRENKYEDPKKVFTVTNGMLRISGEEWGGIATKASYRDYHLTTEWKWGGRTWDPRADRARDSGILVHAVGEDGAYGKTWLESVESQIIEGGSGDFIMVGGKNQPRLTCDVRKGEQNQVYWQKGGEPMTRDRGRFNWFARDPKWQDVLGFRGEKDVEKPVGQWNVQEVICDGDTITNILNGVVVNYGYNSSHTQGKIQIQSEGAEILFRRIELRPIRKRVSHR